MSKMDDMILDVLAGIEKRMDDKIAAVMASAAALGAQQLAEGRAMIRVKVSAQRLADLLKKYDIRQEYDSEHKEWIITVEHIDTREYGKKLAASRAAHEEVVSSMIETMKQNKKDDEP